MIIGVKCHIKHEFSFRSSVYFFKVILLIKKKILIDLTGQVLVAVHGMF